MNFKLKTTEYPQQPTALGYVVAVGQLATSAAFAVFVLGFVFSGNGVKPGESEQSKAQRQSVACAVGEQVPGSLCPIQNR